MVVFPSSDVSFGGVNIGQNVEVSNPNSDEMWDTAQALALDTIWILP